MKTLKCDLYEAPAEGETFEQWMKALQPHYREADPEVMSARDRTPEEIQQDQQKWMAENRAAFEAAPTT